MVCLGNVVEAPSMMSVRLLLLLLLLLVTTAAGGA